MSRSYRAPFVKGSPSDRWREKRLASKAARRSDYGNGNDYRRFYDSYRIDDYVWYVPTEEARRK